MHKIHLAIVTSYPLIPLLESAKSELDNLCRLDILPARSNEEAYQVYLRSSRDYDALLFTGRILMYSVTKRITNIPCPCFAFDDMLSGNVQEILLQLLLENRNFDFSRSFFDLASMRTNYLGLRELLPPEQWPYFADNLPAASPTLTRGDSVAITEAVRQRHIQLHRENKIDISITRFGAIVEDLEKMGMRTIYMLPTREYVINFFMQVINNVGSKKSVAQYPACLLIQFTKDTDEAAISACNQRIYEYGYLHNFDLFTVREKYALRVLTQKNDLERVTRNFSDAAFRQILLGNITGATIGLGAGRTMFQAQRNAADALDIARQTRDIYFISERDQIVGPISAHTAAVYSYVPDARILQLAEQYKLDPVQMQKILSFMQLGGNATITASELADFLNVTQRTANRILEKIRKNGGAHVYEGHAGQGRGRPKKHYQMLFADAEYSETP